MYNIINWHFERFVEIPVPTAIPAKKIFSHPISPLFFKPTCNSKFNYLTHSHANDILVYSEEGWWTFFRLHSGPLRVFFHQLSIFSPCQLVFYLWRWSLQDSLRLSSHVAAACQHKETTRKKREVRELHLQSLILVKLENICSTLPAQQRTQQTTLFSGHLINSIQISTKGWKSNTPVLWRSWVQIPLEPQNFFWAFFATA